jgi:hypothetical protein
MKMTATLHLVITKLQMRGKTSILPTLRTPLAVMVSGIFWYGKTAELYGSAVCFGAFRNGL